MQIIGHRGARGIAPENTILGIRTAMREKVHMIELDVQLHENTLVLSHDPVNIRDSYTTLNDALSHIHGKIPVNLEIKAQKDVTPEQIVAALNRSLARYSGSVVVSSFSYHILREVSKRIPNIPLAVLEKWSGVRAVTKASMLDTHRLHISEKVLWSGFVRSIKHRGYELYAYTVNHRDRAEELETWGVDGIFTDYPNLFNSSHKK